jgi:hypothetical protein
MIQHFDNDEEGYRRWFEAHRDTGFIVNLGGGFPPKLHLVKNQCVPTLKRKNYTTHEYKKDCSTNRRELETKHAPSLMSCKLCFPQEYDS